MSESPRQQTHWPWMRELQVLDDDAGLDDVALSWSSADGNSFDLALTYHGRTVAARVFVDASGAPTDFSATERFCYNPDQPKQLMRARWIAPVAAWEMVDSRPLSSAALGVRPPCECEGNASEIQRAKDELVVLGQPLRKIDIEVFPSIIRVSTCH